MGIISGSFTAVTRHRRRPLAHRGTWGRGKIASTPPYMPCVMNKTLVSLGLAGFTLLACGGSRPTPPPVQPTAPAAKAEVVETPTAKTSTTAAAASGLKDAKLANPEDVRKYISSRPGEEPAETTPIAGITLLSDKELLTIEKCDAARDKAMNQSKKLPLTKQIEASTRAMAKVDKNCSDLKLRSYSQSAAKMKDESAQEQMKILAAAFGKTKSACGRGALNPHVTSMGACFASGPMLWDREGWSCLGKTVADDDRKTLEEGASYAYSFRTNADLGTFEIVGRGCTFLLGMKENAETELVVRGRLGESTDDLVVYRRAARK